VCNDSTVKQIVNDSNVPWDTIIVIVHDPTYGGCAAVSGDVAVGTDEYGSTQSRAPWVSAHEMGHSFAGLADEYVYSYTGPVIVSFPEGDGLNCWNPVYDALKSRNVKDEIVSQFIKTLNNCEFARFAPGDESLTMDKIYKEAIDVISKTENELK
jgi:hypothetical protein